VLYIFEGDVFWGQIYRLFEGVFEVRLGGALAVVKLIFNPLGVLFYVLFLCDGFCVASPCIEDHKFTWWFNSVKI